MVTLAKRHFDVLDYVETSKKLGVDEAVAKYQARQIEEAIDIAIDRSKEEVEHHGKEFATKADIAEVRNEIIEVRNELKLDIKDVEIKLIKWVIGAASVSSITILGALFSAVRYLH